MSACGCGCGDWTDAYFCVALEGFRALEWRREIGADLIEYLEVVEEVVKANRAHGTTLQNAGTVNQRRESTELMHAVCHDALTLAVACQIANDIIEASSLTLQFAQGFLITT